MIDVKVNKGEFSHAVFSGTTPELCADIYVITALLYEQLKENNEKQAEAFKNVFLDDIECIFKDNKELELEVESKEDEIIELLKSLISDKEVDEE